MTPKAYALLALLATLLAVASSSCQVPPEACVKYESKVVHHAEYTYYLKVGYLLLPITSPASDETVTKCVEYAP